MAFYKSFYITATLLPKYR